jgi:hypothetical protein
MRNAYNILVGKPQGKTSLGRWEDDIRIVLREIGWEVVDWIHLAHSRGQWWAVVSTVMNLRVP